MPQVARWSSTYIQVSTDAEGETTEQEQPALRHLKVDIADRLQKALGELEAKNPALDGVLTHINFKATIGEKNTPKLKNNDLLNLLDHFDKPGFVLVNENFEFPDLLGAAYEFLLKYFADESGKRGGSSIRRTPSFPQWCGCLIRARE